MNPKAIAITMINRERDLAVAELLELPYLDHEARCEVSLRNTIAKVECVVRAGE